VGVLSCVDIDRDYAKRSARRRASSLSSGRSSKNVSSYDTPAVAAMGWVNGMIALRSATDAMPFCCCCCIELNSAIERAMSRAASRNAAMFSRASAVVSGGAARTCSSVARASETADASLDHTVASCGGGGPAVDDARGTPNVGDDGRRFSPGEGGGGNEVGNDDWLRIDGECGIATDLAGPPARGGGGDDEGIYILQQANHNLLPRSAA
jgi:hypothetical protein